MNNYKKPICQLAGTLFLALFSMAAHAQKWDDKILIQQCNDRYSLMLDHEKPFVNNTKKITYESK